MAKMIENRMLKPTLEAFRQHLINENEVNTADNTTLGAVVIDPKSSDVVPILADNVKSAPVVPQDH